MDIKQPPMRPVESANLAAIGHADNILWVRFRSGPLGIYRGVPRRLFRQMMKTEDSPGKFFHRHIRSAFDYEEIA